MNEDIAVQDPAAEETVTQLVEDQQSKDSEPFMACGERVQKKRGKRMRSSGTMGGGGASANVN